MNDVRGKSLVQFIDLMSFMFLQTWSLINTQ